MNRHFSKEDTHVAKKHMKKSLVLLIIRETQIKITMWHHLIPVRMVVIKKSHKQKNAYTLLLGVKISSTIVESSVMISQRAKNRTTI